MKIQEKYISLPNKWTAKDVLQEYLLNTVRLSVIDNVCEVSYNTNNLPYNSLQVKYSIVNGSSKYDDQFVVVFIIPTGLGASVGGHAGDATPTLKMIAEVADIVITHPNVVNASDVNEIPSNTLYVEGNILSRFIAGNIGLKPVRSNKILVVLSSNNKQSIFTKFAIHTVDAAYATYGFNCPKIVIIDDLDMGVSYTNSGRASGYINNLDPLNKLLQNISNYDCDAIAIASELQCDPNINKQYFQSYNEEVNPWGGVEALLTHYISQTINLPSAHAPIDISDFDLNDINRIDPRKAVEAISSSYFQCVLKGLHKTPKIISDDNNVNYIGRSNIDAIVMPAGCVGLPNLLADIYNIPVIGVNDSLCIPKTNWVPKNYISAQNYQEAAGILCAMKAGVSLSSVQRPIKNIPLEILS